MRRFQYRRGAVLADYSRAGAGLMVSGGLLLFTELLPAVAYILSGMVVLFAAYGGRTLFRQFTSVEVSQEGLRTHNELLRGLERSLDWNSLRDMQVRYFSTRRDRSNGWMQLVVKGDGTRIQVDSTLEGFENVVRRACEAARTRGLILSVSTTENLKAMGMALEREREPT